MQWHEDGAEEDFFGNGAGDVVAVADPGEEGGGDGGGGDAFDDEALEEGASEEGDSQEKRTNEG